MVHHLIDGTEFVSHITPKNGEGRHGYSHGAGADSPAGDENDVSFGSKAEEGGKGCHFELVPFLVLIDVFERGLVNFDFVIGSDLQFSHVDNIMGDV